jgi:hypothetical protein
LPILKGIHQSLIAFKNNGNHIAAIYGVDHEKRYHEDAHVRPPGEILQNSLSRRHKIIRYFHKKSSKNEQI